MQTIKIAIVDDHKLFNIGLKSILEQNKNGIVENSQKPRRL